MELEEIEKKRKGICSKTKSSMKKIGTYRPEFTPTIERYAEMRMQYDILNEQWYEDGCIITEEYTNRSGATNKRKTALYLSLETLRKELIDIENLLGLTPRGLKQIRAKSLEAGKGSKLDSVLAGIGGG